VALTVLALHLLLAAAVSSGLARDELETVFFAQGWAWGYDPEQPPLYNWLTQALTDGLGPSLAASAGLRWVIIVLGVLALYDAVRRMAGGDAALAAGAVAGAAGTALFGYEGALHFTHTTLLVTATAAVLWAVTRVVERPSVGRYLVLGLALLAACLSKYTFAVFGLALVLAALTDPLLRRRLRTPRLIWAALPVLLVLPGHLIWRLHQDMVLSDRVASITSQGRGVPLPFWERVSGLAFDVMLDPIAGMAPPLVLIGLLALVGTRRALRQDAALSSGVTGRTGATVPAGPVRWPRVLLVFVVASMALTLAIVLVEGGHRVRYHYMMPAALVLPTLLLLWCRARAVVLVPWCARALGWGLTGLAVVMALGVAVDRLVLEPWNCDRCLSRLPVSAAAEAVRAEGFTGRGTILAADLDWAANLRRVFPEARVLARSRPDWRPPGDAPGDGACLVILFPREASHVRSGGSLAETDLAGSVASLSGVAPGAIPLDRARVVSLPVTTTIFADVLRPGRRRVVSFGVLVVPDGLGTCR